MAAVEGPVLHCSLDVLLVDRGITGKQLVQEVRVTEVTFRKLRRNVLVLIDAGSFARIAAYMLVKPGDLLTIRS